MPIFDQGYQHWSGELSSHVWRWWTITRHGFRVGMQSWILRIMLLIAWLPAIALAFFLCAWGLLEQKSPLIAPIMPLLAFLDPILIENPLQYRVEFWTLCFDYFMLTEMRFSMILILLVGPNLISQDLRFNALPLYLSRPLRRIDYFAGKLGVIAAFLGMVLIVPAIIAYVLGLLFSLDITILRDTLPLLLACLAYGAIMVISAGTFILALSSLSRNSRYIALFWVAIWFVSGMVGLILDNVHREQQRQVYYQRMYAEESLPPPSAPKAREQREQVQRARQEARRRAQEEMLAAEEKAEKMNWRPMVSYTANLARIGQFLLRTDACWEKLSQNKPEEERRRFLAEYRGPQYPWYWSAILLAALLGISVCILSLRIKSLDRLK